MNKETKRVIRKGLIVAALLWLGAQTGESIFTTLAGMIQNASVALSP